ncbi:putative triosephosphate isomerase, cytosolic-like [Capsicum annuum]|nr:putative triosephosphate isomerase, cytosolic-like [Capsicum annuum]
MRSHERRAPVVVDGGGSGGNWFNRGDGVGAGSGSGSGSGGCYSHDSEPDLAAMVSEFLESSSASAESWCSSDNDSGFSDFALLADRITKDNCLKWTYPCFCVYKCSGVGAESRYSSDNDSGFSVFALLIDRISLSRACGEFGVKIEDNEEKANGLSRIPLSRDKPNQLRSLAGGNGFKPRKQPLVDMQGKAAYNRPLWLDPSPDPAHSKSFSGPGCPILLDKNSVDQYEIDLTMVVHSLILSMTESCCTGKPETCNASCIRSYLVKLLQSCGYNADLCATKWQGCGKIPGGEHEYIQVISHGSDGYSERYIIDLDFQSHFEIARAVKSYNVVLSCLPPVYVGTVTKLKLYLQAMVEAAKCSLKQNSMPLPPWRSLAYLEAKWESSSQRVVNVQVQSSVSPSNSCHRHCTELLWRIKSCIGSEIKAKGFLFENTTSKLLDATRKVRGAQRISETHEKFHETDEQSVSTDEPYVAKNESITPTDESYVATEGSSVATDGSYVATDRSSVGRTQGL